MNDPEGFDLVDGKVVEPAAVGRAVQHEHVARADPHVPGGLPRLRLHRRGRVRVRVAARAARPLPPHRAGRDARVRLAGRAGPGRRRRLGRRGRSPSTSRSSSRRSRACSTRRRARRSRSAASTTPTPARCASGSRCRSCCRCSPTTTRTRRSPGSTRCRRGDRPPVNIVRFAFQTMVGIGTGLALLGVVFFVTWLRRHRLPRSPWFYRAVMAAGPLVVRRADRGLDHHRGRPPAVDRLRGHAHEQAVTVGRRAGGRLRGAGRSSTSASARPSCWLLRRLARKPAETEVAR